MWKPETTRPEDPCCALLEAVAVRIRAARYFAPRSSRCHAGKEASTWLLEALIRVSPIRYDTRVEYAEFGASTAYRKNYEARLAKHARMFMRMNIFICTVSIVLLLYLKRSDLSSSSLPTFKSYWPITWCMQV